MNSPYLADWNPAKLKGPSQSVKKTPPCPQTALRTVVMIAVGLD